MAKTKTVTTLTGIDVLGDGYDSVYVNDRLVSTSDGSDSYSVGAADALSVYLEAKEVVISLEPGNKKKMKGDPEEWWYDLSKSSLKHVLKEAKAFGLKIKTFPSEIAY